MSEMEIHPNGKFLYGSNRGDVSLAVFAIDPTTGKLTSVEHAALPERPLALHNDMFEIVVDGDLSGGPLIDQAHRDMWTPEGVGPEMSRLDPRLDLAELHWASHGVQAQNYHIFTSALDKDWCMAWSSASWIKEFPSANSACRYHFKPGEPGKLTLEFTSRRLITPGRTAPRVCPKVWVVQLK